MSEDQEKDMNDNNGESDKEEVVESSTGPSSLVRIAVLGIIIVIIGSIGAGVYGYSSAFSRSDNDPISREVQIRTSGGVVPVEIVSYTGSDPFKEILTTLTDRSVEHWHILAGEKKDQLSGQIYRTNIEIGKLGSFVQTYHLTQKYIEEGFNKDEARQKALQESNSSKFVSTKFIAALQKTKIGLGMYGTEKEPAIVLRGPNEVDQPRNRVIIPKKGVIIFEGQSYEIVFEETRTILENLILNQENQNNTGS